MGAWVDTCQVNMCVHTIPTVGVGVGVTEMYIHGSVDKENIDSSPKLCKAKTYLLCPKS